MRAPSLPLPTFQQAPDDGVQVELLAVGHGGAATPAHQLWALSCLPPSCSLLPAWLSFRPHQPAPSPPPRLFGRPPRPAASIDPCSLAPPLDGKHRSRGGPRATGRGLAGVVGGVWLGGVGSAPPWRNRFAAFRRVRTGSTVEIVFLFPSLFPPQPCVGLWCEHVNRLLLKH